MNKYELVKRGRVKDVYKIDPKTQVIVLKDYIAFDNVVLESRIPEKGIVVKELLEFWFEYTKSILPNNLITTKNQQMPQFFWEDRFLHRSMMVEKVDVLPVQPVVRGYLTGAAWDMYQNTGDVGDIVLPEGLEKNTDT